MNTKLHAVSDANGLPLSFFMTAGRVSDYTGAAALLDEMPKAQWLLGDRGYDADWFTQDPGKFFTSGVTAGSRFRFDTISVSVGAPDSPEQFEANLEYAAKSAFEQGGQDSLLAIYWFVPNSGEAYDFIGVMLRQKARAA